MKVLHEVVQGSTITFNANFFDPANNVVQPSNVVLQINYFVNNVPTINTLTMTNSTNVWITSWGSNVADVGVVAWKVFGFGLNEICEQGTFRLL